MRAPATAAAVALLWLVAQAIDLPWLAAATVVLGLGAPAVLAVGRRADARARAGLAAGLALLMLVLAAWLGLQLVLQHEALLARLGLDPSPALPLLADLAMLAILAPLAPLIYAWTFPSTRPDRNQ